MSEPPADRDVLIKLLEAAVPERTDEVSRHWDMYNPEVEVAPDKQGITMNADSRRIQFSAKTIEIFWLLGFSAWRSIETYAPAIVLASLAGITIDAALGRDLALPQFERDFKERLVAAQSIMNGTQTDFRSWPPDIPKPESDRDRMQDPQHQAAFDLVCLALAFSFLHEFRHVMLLNDGETPSERPEEEILCDVWAREFLTAKLAAYAKTRGHTYDQVLTKRAMGIALGVTILHAITPAHSHWGNGDYPPIADRIEALIGNTKLPDDSYFWIFSASLLTGLMRQAHKALDFVPLSPRKTVEELLARLR